MAFDGATFEIDPLTLTTPRARLEYLRDFLRALPAERFNMDIGTLKAGDCGSAACIGGWAREVFRLPLAEGLFGVGTSLFDFSSEQCGGLFFPYDAAMGDGTPALTAGGGASARDAADVLDHLIATGEVDWSVARKAEA